MAKKRQNETQKPNPIEQEMLEELQRALNQQFSETFVRIQKDYGQVGTRMAESANAILEDQDFVDFMFGFYDSTRVLLNTPTFPDQLQAYQQALSSALFVHKWEHGLPINVPCHAEEVIAGDRYLRRFLREFFNDTFKAKMAAKAHQTQ